MGTGDHDFLLAKGNLEDEVVELMEEGEVNQGEEGGEGDNQDLGGL